VKLRTMLKLTPFNGVFSTCANACNTSRCVACLEASSSAVIVDARLETSQFMQQALDSRDPGGI
jgi:hypothetical protein